MADKILNQVLLNKDIRVGADFDKWMAFSNGEAIDIALKDKAAVIEVMKEAPLRGLGGSGFPAHIKWQAVSDQPNDGDKYLICNGNEDEPGTFKDRVLLEDTPHQIIEGAIVTAIATGINKIYFYINPDIAAGLKAMYKSVAQWKESKIFTDLNKKLDKPIELLIHESAGIYIGGEETAAISNIEGGFPFPKAKPPYPAESGIFGRPTLINNMETICNVTHIVRNGAKWYKDLGIGEKAQGTKLFSVSGDILKPGVYELPMGIALKEVIYNYGGGMLLDKEFKAVFMGGPSNTILTKNDLDVHLDYESVKERRSGLGTGAIIVVSEGTGIVKRVAEYMNFFAYSSCGQCPSCKSGTYYFSMLLDKIDTGRGTNADLKNIENLCKILPGSGKCHLLEGATKLVDSSLYNFMDEYKQSLKS